MHEENQLLSPPPKIVPTAHSQMGDVPATGEAALRAVQELAVEEERALRVLLVDDHDDMLDMMHLLLTRHSYSVITANSGHKALEVAESFAPHIVVSDIGMPEMNGYEMMTRLRAMPQLSPFKAIALTGYDVQEDQENVRAAGFDAHLTKPIDFDQLFSIIGKLTS